jgi:hypothetical protein
MLRLAVRVWFSRRISGRLALAPVLALALAVGCENECETDTTPPAGIVDLAASGGTPCSMTLSWTATGDDGVVGRAASYDLRYSTSPISEADWTQAARCEGEPEPDSSGASEQFTALGLAAGTQYFFRVVTVDESQNISDLSNTASAVTLPAETEPGVAWVRDGSGEVDEDWTALASELSATWAAVEGAAGYEYSIGTSPGAAEVVSWQAPPVPLETAVTREGLALSEGTTYYFSVRALVEGGCSGYGTSDGVTVDTGSPCSEVVPIEGPQCGLTLKVGWAGADSVSGIAAYDIQVKDGPEGPWADWLAGTTDTAAFFTGKSGRYYFFRSRARDRAGNEELYPPGPDAWVEVGPDIDQVAWVRDGLGYDASWTSDSTELSANWATALGAEEYECAVGTRRGDSDLVNWTPVGNRNHVTWGDLVLVDGRTYFFAVRARRGNCRGPARSSNGIRVDVSPPVSYVEALPETTYSPTDYYAIFTVSWHAEDTISGISYTEGQWREGETGEWSDIEVPWWKYDQIAEFTGFVGRTYYFRCRAADVAGNLEQYPDAPDVRTCTAYTPTQPPTPPPVNPMCKIALHLVPGGSLGCSQPPAVDELDDVNRVWSTSRFGSSLQVFLVVFDYDSLSVLEFGLDWPADWGSASFHACSSPLQVGSIANPGDGVALAYTTCQVSAARGGARPRFWPTCWVWLTPRSNGEIGIIRNRQSDYLAVTDCRPIEHRSRQAPVVIYNAGVNVDPYEGPPYHWTAMDEIDRLFK